MKEISLYLFWGLGKESGDGWKVETASKLDDDLGIGLQDAHAASWNNEGEKGSLVDRMNEAEKGSIVGGVNEEESASDEGERENKILNGISFCLGTWTVGRMSLRVDVLSCFDRTSRLDTFCVGRLIVTCVAALPPRTSSPDSAWTNALPGHCGWVMVTGPF